MSGTPYESLISAAAGLAGLEGIAEIDDATAAVAFVERNRSALEAARRALGPQCAVPVRFEPTYFDEHFPEVSHLRNLTHAFRLEALSAAARSDVRGAAEIGIDILELGNSARRGGLVVDMLVGLSISAIGINCLRKLRTAFDGETRRMLIERLSRLEAEREPFDDVVARDRAWDAAVGWKDEPCDFKSMELLDSDECGLSEEQQRCINDAIQAMSKLPEPVMRSFHRENDQKNLAMLRMLAIDAALRERRAEAGAFPNDLSALTPRLLPEPAPDPFTGTAFRYRRDEEAFLLHSPGPTGQDSGGRFGAWFNVANGDADLCLDAFDYEPACGCPVPQRRGIVQRVTDAVRGWSKFFVQQDASPP
jgi:hypothetical protein